MPLHSLHAAGIHRAADSLRASHMSSKKTVAAHVVEMPAKFKHYLNFALQTALFPRLRYRAAMHLGAYVIPAGRLCECKFFWGKPVSGRQQAKCKNCEKASGFGFPGIGAWLPGHGLHWLGGPVCVQEPVAWAFFLVELLGCRELVSLSLLGSKNPWLGPPWASFLTTLEFLQGFGFQEPMAWVPELLGSQEPFSFLPRLCFQDLALERLGSILQDLLGFQEPGGLRI